MKPLRRLVLVLTVAVTLVATATPAWAAGHLPKVGEQRPWFYWIAPLLVLGALGLLGMLALGYYLRVLRPRLRGR